MRRVICCALGMLALAQPVQAQGGFFGPSPHRPSIGDKTGTDPLNLQQQVDVVDDYVELDALFLNATTYRHGVALFNRRIRVTGGVPLVFSNVTGRTEGGLGDLEADVEWTPLLSAHGGLVVGLRSTWSTATIDELGWGVHTAMPYGQYVFRVSDRMLVAPLVGQRVGAGGDGFARDINDTVVGLLAVWRARPRVWIATQPQVVFDLEQERTYGDVGGEIGCLLLDRLSTYVRPSIGFGSRGDKPYTWGLTFGFRIVP